LIVQQEPANVDLDHLDADAGHAPLTMDTPGSSKKQKKSVKIADATPEMILPMPLKIDSTAINSRKNSTGSIVSADSRTPVHFVRHGSVEVANLKKQAADGDVDNNEEEEEEEVEIDDGYDVDTGSTSSSSGDEEIEIEADDDIGDDTNDADHVEATMNRSHMKAGVRFNTNRYDEDAFHQEEQSRNYRSNRIASSRFTSRPLSFKQTTQSSRPFQQHTPTPSPPPTTLDPSSLSPKPSQYSPSNSSNSRSNSPMRPPATTAANTTLTNSAGIAITTSSSIAATVSQESKNDDVILLASKSSLSSIRVSQRNLFDV
jgi:hypothetical protein